MFGVALGIRNIQSQLPDLVYALLSGLNAATVGLIAVAGVQLSERAITDKMTRFLIAATASVGILYQGNIVEQNAVLLVSFVVFPRVDGPLRYCNVDLRLSNYSTQWSEDMEQTPKTA